MKLFSLICSIFAATAAAHSAGVDTCVDAPGHGSWAAGCSPTSCSTNPYPLSLRTLSGNVVSSYQAYTNYSIVLGNPAATGACTSTTCFRGFIMNVGLGNLTGTYSSISSLSTNAGFMRLDSTDANVRQMTSCPNGLTQKTSSNVHFHKAIWTSCCCL